MHSAESPAAQEQENGVEAVVGEESYESNWSIELVTMSVLDQERLIQHRRLRALAFPSPPA